MQARKAQKRRTKKKGRNVRPYPFEFRLRVVRLRLEEGYPPTLIHDELGVSTETISVWTKKYQKYGKEGLKTKKRVYRQAGTLKAIKNKIVDIKRSNPAYGSRRIPDTLKRYFLIRTSPSTVQRTLSQEGLTQPAKRESKKNPSKPRFF